MRNFVSVLISTVNLLGCVDILQLVATNSIFDDTRQVLRILVILKAKYNVLAVKNAFVPLDASVT